MKRSITVAGHRTSLSLEDEFWEALAEAASHDGKTVAAIVAEIDRSRQELNLSSAIRVWILRRLQGKASASVSIS